MSDDISPLCLETSTKKNRLLIIRCSGKARCRHSFPNKFTAQEDDTLLLNAKPCGGKALLVQTKKF